MPLAALSFSDPLMLAGTAAALIPILLHLLNRIRAPLVEFPTLRFLRITAQKTARRRQLQQYLLLLLRIIVFALIALAVAAPLIRGGSPALAYGFVGMLLLGLCLLVLAIVLGAGPSEEPHPSRAPKEATDAHGHNPSPPNPQSPFPNSTHHSSLITHYFPLRRLLALPLLLAALALAAYSAYGLASDRYFSSQHAAPFSGQNTALVVLFDNSHSMLAHLATSSQTRLARARTLTRELLSTLSPREAAIVLTNPGDAPAPGGGLTANMFLLAGTLEKSLPTASARPMQERLRTALDLLHASPQPSKLLVIVSDFAQPAFADAQLFAPLKNLPWRQDLQVVLLPVAPPDSPDAHPADVGIASFTLAQGTPRPAVGAEVTFEARLINNADSADIRDLSLSIDGKTEPAASARVDSAPLHPRVQLGPAGTPSATATVRIPYRLRDPGLHRFTIQLDNSTDAMPWDDSRQLALDVADQIPVLVIGAEPGTAPRPRSAAFYFRAALAPFEGTTTPWSIKPTYRGIDQLQSPADLSSLSTFSAIFLCDIPRISAPLADALATYAKSTATGTPGSAGTATAGGGRLIWILGPSIDSSAYNQILLSRGLLPAPLGSPLVAPKAQPLDWVDTRSGLFINLFDSQEPFRSALITGHWSLTDIPPIPNSQFPITPPSGRILARLADASPLLLRHSAIGGGAADSGRIYTLLTSPAADWSNLGGTTLLVPLVTRMALGDFQDGPLLTSYDTGQLIPLRIPALDNTDPATLRRISLDVTTPGTGTLNVKPSLSANSAPSANSPQFLFDHAADPGLYSWKSSDNRFTGIFVANPPGTEADLLPADLHALAQESSLSSLSGSPSGTPTGTSSDIPPTLIAQNAPDLLAQLAHRGEGASLTPGFLALVLILALLEALLANRHRAT